MSMNWGSIGGGALGGVAGTAIAGPIGGMIGSSLGSSLGGSLFGGGDDEEGVSLPSAGESVAEWASILPRIWDVQSEFAPKQAALQFGTLADYAPQFAELQRDIRQQIMPETYGLQEQMARMASEGLSGGLTDAEERQFLDLQKSLVGEQTTSGLGTDFIGGNLLNYIQNRKVGNQNLATNLLNMMYGNVNTGYTPGYSDFMSTFTPSTVMNYNLGGYGATPAPQSGSSGLGAMLGTLAGSFGSGNPMQSATSFLQYGGNRTGYPGGTGSGSSGFIPNLDSTRYSGAMY